MDNKNISKSSTSKENTENKRIKNHIFYSSRPGLRPGSLDRNPKMKRETKNITTV